MHTNVNDKIHRRIFTVMCKSSIITSLSSLVHRLSPHGFCRILIATYFLSHLHWQPSHQHRRIDIVNRHIVSANHHIKIVDRHVVIVYRHIAIVTCLSSHGATFRATVLNTRLTIYVGARNYRYMAWVVKHS